MERAILAKAGVVDEDVDGKTRAFGGVVDLLRRGRIVEVGGDDPDLGPRGSKFLGQGIQAVLAAGGENQLCAATGEFTSQRDADPGAAAGDQGPSALEVCGTCHRTP